jgi:pyruvate/2-oxoacid:ferredoxin oxidoreductase alpha subunit
MAPKKSSSGKKYVVVRTYSMGVHYGELVSHEGTSAVLANARHIWSWNGGRLTVNDIAAIGARTGDKISRAVESISLEGVGLVVTCSADAEKSLREAAAS